MNTIARSRRVSNSSGEAAESGSNIRLRRDGDDANLGRRQGELLRSIRNN